MSPFLFCVASSCLFLILFSMRLRWRGTTTTPIVFWFFVFCFFQRNWYERKPVFVCRATGNPGGDPGSRLDFSQVFRHWKRNVVVVLFFLLLFPAFWFCPPKTRICVFLLSAHQWIDVEWLSDVWKGTIRIKKFQQQTRKDKRKTWN